MKYEVLFEEVEYNLTQIFEAWMPTLEKGKTPVVVTHGRFSVPHAGHFGLFEHAWKEGKKKGAKKLVIVIVMGKKSSMDKEKNPTTFEERKALINKGLKVPHEVVLVNGGFTGTIIDELRKKDLEPVVFTGGPDRIDDYTNQLNKSGKDWNSDAIVTGIKGERLAGGASATKVRKAIRDNDLETYKKFMPKGLHSEFKKLQKILKVK